MGMNTLIEWADDSVGFWWGCREKGPGCLHCYARDGYPVAIAESQMDRRLWDSKRSAKDRRPSVRMHVAGAADELRRLDRKAEREGRPRLVFINSQSDTFEETNAMIVKRLSPKEAEHVGRPYLIARKVDGKCQWIFPEPICLQGMEPWTLDDERREMFSVIYECTNLRCLLLTKRPDKIRAKWPVWTTVASTEPGQVGRKAKPRLNNVWLGTSVATQADAETNIDALMKCRDLTPVLFVSAEPLIEAVSFKRWVGLLDWIILGGESGPEARDFDLAWPRQTIAECRGSRTAVFLKQTGRTPTESLSLSAAEALYPHGIPRGLKIEGQLSSFTRYAFKHKKGGDPAEWPEDLRHARQYPEVSA